MFDWLNDSFEEHTAAWLLISSLVGGVIGAAVKFTFEDLLRPMLGWRRESRQVARKYTTPLVRSAESLERRINILVRNEREHWYDSDELFRLATLYAFGEHLGWVRIVEERFGFLPFESSRKGSDFNRRLNGIFRALSSHAYFRAADDELVAASAVPRAMLTAVGECMSRPDEDGVLQFTDFCKRYVDDDQFRRWFAELDAFLRAAHPRDPLRWDRMILAAAHLRGLILFLDPRGRMVDKRELENLERLKTDGVAEEVTRHLS